MRTTLNKLAVTLAVALFFLAATGCVFAQPPACPADVAALKDFLKADERICTGSCLEGKFVSQTGHCFYNEDYLDLRGQPMPFKFDSRFSPKSAGGSNGTFVVPMFTEMTINNFSTFKSVCVDGATGTGVHAVDLYVNGVKVGDNHVAKDSDSCFGGGVRLEGAQQAIKYRFAVPGLHHVQIWVATQSNGTCGMLAKEFDVLVIQPILSINGSSNLIVAFKKSDGEKTTYITWSITNLGTSIARIKNVAATGCSDGLQCTILGLPSADSNVLMSVEPGQTFLLIEQVKASKPSAVPTNYSLGVKVNFTDEFGASDLWKEPMHPVEKVTLSALLIEEQRFHVELFAGYQNYCIGKDGRLGSTGIADVPKVLFNWDWSGIDENTCNMRSRTDVNFVYCDPTQFSIELLRRLNSINEVAMAGDLTKATLLSHFQAYLIGDAFSDDFRKDFDYHYTRGAFFDTPAWYNGIETPWNSYFTDNALLSFEPNAISSGLYDVLIEFEFPGEQYKFFCSSQACAKIKVKLTKMRESLSANPFYLLPFNGNVGLEARPGEETPVRVGYGLGFSGPEIKVNEFGQGRFVSTKGASDNRTVLTSFEQDFNKLNIENSGIILSISKNGSAIWFSPSAATPVIMQIEGSGKGKVDAYYYVSEVPNKIVHPAAGYLNLWTGFASTPMGCSNFDNTALYYRRHDSKAENVQCVSTDASYGFSWQNVAAQNQSGKLFMQSVFYTPLAASMTLRSDCPGTTLIGPSGPGQNVSLNYKAVQANLENVFSLLREKYVCVSVEGDNMEFWWNPQQLISDLNAVKSRNINPAWICPVEGEAR